MEGKTTTPQTGTDKEGRVTQHQTVLTLGQELEELLNNKQVVNQELHLLDKCLVQCKQTKSDVFSASNHSQCLDKLYQVQAGSKACKLAMQCNCHDRPVIN